MDLVIKNARLRPRMYGLNGSFSDYVAFLVGYDTGLAGSLLGGFSEWVAHKSDGVGSNLFWPYLVLRESGVYDWAGFDWHQLNSDDDACAVERLFQLLEEFEQRKQD
uniref:hypothetical protein n=1 Tax=Streptomyces sp. NBC_01001 TaxID=2903713 RepID=UPI002F90ABAD|nr:hypothetical protein OG296_40880 [Streptomyces sp. NBC_01001]